MLLRGINFALTRFMISAIALLLLAASVSATRAEEPPTPVSYSSTNSPESAALAHYAFMKYIEMYPNQSLALKKLPLKSVIYCLECSVETAIQYSDPRSGKLVLPNEFRDLLTQDQQVDVHIKEYRQVINAFVREKSQNATVPEPQSPYLPLPRAAEIKPTYRLKWDGSILKGKTLELDLSKGDGETKIPASVDAGKTQL